MKRREIIIHIVCWLIYSLIMFYWQSNLFDSRAALIHVTRSTIIGMAVFYINLYLLLPRLFYHGKYVQYSLYILLLFMSVHFIFEFSASVMPHPQFRPDELRRSAPPPGFGLPERPGKWDRTIVFSMINIIPMLFFSTILWITDENRKRKQREITLLSENLHSEMRFLKSQINPHFLFNALNNIYSLSFTKSEKAPQMIMKLSEMLRHVVYDSGNAVKLEKEIAYINHFIDFQKLKTGEEINVVFDYQLADKSFMIEPMLLIPFVENAFKHGDVENHPEGFIRIQLSTEGPVLNFEVENSRPVKEHTKDRFSGIGIENVTKRLDLAYPGKSRFRKEVSKNRFKIYLTLQR